MSRFIFKKGGAVSIAGSDISFTEGMGVRAETVEIYDCTNNRMNPDDPSYGPLHAELIFDEEPCGEWEWCPNYPKRCTRCIFRGW